MQPDYHKIINSKSYLPKRLQTQDSQTDVFKFYEDDEKTLKVKKTNNVVSSTSQKKDIYTP